MKFRSRKPPPPPSPPSPGYYREGSRPPATFNADDNEITRALAALERPTFQRGGTRYVGQILSAEKWRPFEPRFFALDEGTLDDAQIQHLIYDYVRAVFPQPWWKLWRKSAATAVWQMSYPLQILALKHFLARQTPAIAVWLGRQEETEEIPPSSTPHAAGASPRDARIP